MRVFHKHRVLVYGQNSIVSTSEYTVLDLKMRARRQENKERGVDCRRDDRLFVHLERMKDARL